MLLGFKRFFKDEASLITPLVGYGLDGLSNPLSHTDSGILLALVKSAARMARSLSPANTRALVNRAD